MLEDHKLTEKLVEAINRRLSARGLLLLNGTIVDATLIAAPPSTKNRNKQPGPEMHQSKKRQQWYFGMKAHVSVDVESRLVHKVVGTSGNVADVTRVGEMLHVEEKSVHVDARYVGAEKREEVVGRDITWHIVLEARLDQEARRGQCLPYRWRRLSEQNARFRAWGPADFASSVPP